MKTVLELVLAIAITATISVAHADGPGGVTWDKTMGANAPACHQFRTNGGPLTYGVSVNAPSYAGFLGQLTRSASGLCAMDFSIATSIPECPGYTAVSGVTCQ